MNFVNNIEELVTELGEQRANTIKNSMVYEEKSLLKE